ncbi:hypothetical protein JXR74_06490 [Candidatus Mcinerneyibacteriota bacterium]|nr:hypothetical protein [Candidatus Mcinerneyibacteriota bacterium]
MKAEAALYKEMITEENSPLRFTAYGKKFSAAIHEGRLQIFLHSGRKEELQTDIILPDKALVSGTEIALSPSLPDKPLSLDPARSIYVLAGATVSFFIPVPLWATLTVNGLPVKDIILKEFSKTWIGEVGQNGDLGYTHHQEPMKDDSTLLPDAAYMEIIIENKSRISFDVKRLILYVPFTALYKNEAGYLFTDRQKFTISPNNKQDIKLMRPASSGIETVARPRRKASKDYFTRFATFLKKVTVMS